MKKLLLAVIAGLALFAQPALAGWEYCIPSSAFQCGGTFGTATCGVLGASNRPYVQFGAGANDNHYATAEFSLPAFLTSASLTARIYGRINSTTTTNDVCTQISAQISTAGDVDSLWESNDGVGTQPASRALNPLATANATIHNATLLGSFLPRDQATTADCASVAACANAPGRVRVQRVNSGGGCTNDDAAVFQMIKVCLFGTF